MQQTRKHPEWQELIEKTKELPWGTEIAYGQIEQWSGVRHGDNRWPWMIGHWRKQMECEYGRPVQVDAKRRLYRVLTHEEIPPSALKIARLGTRRFRWATRRLVNAPFHAMPDALRNLVTNMGVRMGMITQMAQREVAGFKELPGASGGPANPRVLKGQSKPE